MFVCPRNNIWFVGNSVCISKRSKAYSTLILIVCGKFLVSDLEAGWIDVAILECRDGQPLLGTGMRNQFQDDLQRGKGFGAPVDRNEGKESMLNLVPLASGRWIMRNRDAEMFFIGQFLELFLPEAVSGTVGAAPICGDEHVVLAGIKLFA